MGKRKHVLNEAQLAMFIPAHKLMDTVTPEAVDDSTTKPQTLRSLPHVVNYKRAEAKESDLVESIRQQGVTDPVTIVQNPHVYKTESGDTMRDDYFPGHNYRGQMIADGHHRIVVANDLNPNAEIPVKYD
jgi:ParB-like chromosome segregation protein Spo0J